MQLQHALTGVRVDIASDGGPGALQVAIYTEDRDGQTAFVDAFETGPFDTTTDVMHRIAAVLVRARVAKRM